MGDREAREGGSTDDTIIGLTGRCTRTARCSAAWTSPEITAVASPRLLPVVGSTAGVTAIGSGATFGTGFAAGRGNNRETLKRMRPRHPHPSDATEGCPASIITTRPPIAAATPASRSSESGRFMLSLYDASVAGTCT